MYSYKKLSSVDCFDFFTLRYTCLYCNFTYNYHSLYVMYYLRYKIYPTAC